MKCLPWLGCFLLCLPSFLKQYGPSRSIPKDPSVISPEHQVVEPWIYQEDFEDRELGAWASYPLWQDIAYNQNFRVNEMVPGDSNISIVQKVTPYTAVDNYAGAQKLLHMFLVPGASLQFKYYLKTHQTCDWLKVRFAADSLGKLDVTLPMPVTNEWQQVTLTTADFRLANPKLEGHEKIRIHALAFLAKFADADPDMPIYFGLDEVRLEAARPSPFRFLEPNMIKLPEFEPYIPQKYFHSSDSFYLRGTWFDEAKNVNLDISPFTQDRSIYHAALRKNDELWEIEPFQLNFPEGLYKAVLTADDGGPKKAETIFTIHIAPKGMTQKHPRLLFDEKGKQEIMRRFEEPRFQKLHEGMLDRARDLRQQIPVTSLHFDLDQFPDEDWLPSWDSWGARIYHTGEALRLNARAYAFHNDKIAGTYVKDILLELASWPNWTHPWQTKRGRYSEHRTGSWSHRVAEAYDLVYSLLTPTEISLIRQAIFKNIIEGVHQTYVYNDNITAATSNWIAMTVGGSLMCQSALFNDGTEGEKIEPYFTGSILKLHRFLHRVTDSKDGGWGEGFGYNNYSFSNLSYSLPALENVFNIDLYQPLAGTYKEYIWAGLIKKKRWFEYGDSRGNLTSAKSWAFLLHKYRNPLLSWFYHFLKENKTNYVANNEAKDLSSAPQTIETYEDVLFDVADIPQESPFTKNPVKLFEDLGTVVFKSGWEEDDFVFVMRSGPGYNHQHMDQGSFWLADRGQIFVQERPLANSHYYDDPIYESWLTQPIGHSTLLINGNHQSQRMGDHLNFAPGFDDRAQISHFIDGEQAAFASADIGKLYWGKVQSLSRNILYLKPRGILMLDVVEPSEEDVSVELLFQCARLTDIMAGPQRSIINQGGHSLQIQHLFPASVHAQSVETPHYIKTLQKREPLEKEGMLLVEAQTDRQPLVVANFLSTDTDNLESSFAESGFISGTAAGKNLAFSTKLDQPYQVGDMQTDALALTWNDDHVLVAKAKIFANSEIRIVSDQHFTFELSGSKTIKYASTEKIELIIELDEKPSLITLNDREMPIHYDGDAKQLFQTIGPGPGTLIIR